MPMRQQVNTVLLPALSDDIWPIWPEGGGWGLGYYPGYGGVRLGYGWGTTSRGFPRVGYGWGTVGVQVGYAGKFSVNRL